jgi:catechol 2,3-dioxygenase-like lactoylglutathione lyase family enzyme
MTDTTPLITGVDFVCIPAQDFDAMTVFYGETLGLPFVKRYGTRPGAEYQAGNLTLDIMRTEDFGGTFSRNAMPIALQVADVAVAREQLEAKGVRFVSQTFDSIVGRRSAWTLTATHCRFTTAPRRPTNAPRRRSRFGQTSVPGQDTFRPNRNDCRVGRRRGAPAAAPTRRLHANNGRAGESLVSRSEARRPSRRALR